LAWRIKAKVKNSVQKYLMCNSIPINIFMNVHLLNLNFNLDEFQITGQVLKSRCFCLKQYWIAVSEYETRDPNQRKMELKLRGALISMG